MVAFYRREREHEVSGSAARARPVSANEGTRRSVLSAEGCCVLWRAAGAFAGGGVVWFRGGQGRGPGVFSSVPPCLTVLGRGRGGWGSTEMESSAWLQGKGELEQRRPQ
jgi:hypothetical protein